MMKANHLFYHIYYPFMFPIFSFFQFMKYLCDRNTKLKKDINGKQLW